MKKSNNKIIMVYMCVHTISSHEIRISLKIYEYNNVCKNREEYS